MQGLSSVNGFIWRRFNGLTALFARNLYANQGGSQEKIPAEIKSEVEPSFSFLETHFWYVER